MTDVSPMPKVGEKAPGFSGKDQNGNTVSLADFRGKKVVLYFYPKDNTSGCTKQACNLRDGQGTLTASGIAVVGVSADSVKSHGRFADRYDLPFPLIADEDLEIVKRYGVYGEKNLYGIKSLGIKRTTFLIDEDGKILHVFRKPNTGDHTQEILGKLV